MIIPNPTLVVIGREPCESAQGQPIAIGEYVRLPFEDALRLTHAQKVTLGTWKEQQEVDVPLPVTDAVSAETTKPVRGRYRRADLRAKH